MNRLNEFCLAIKIREGWGGPGTTVNGVYYPNGTLSFRNKNPGNLRWSKYQAGQRCSLIKKQCYAYFDSEEDGNAALEFDLQAKCTGNTRAKDASGKLLNPDSTILNFCEAYAPSSDGNRPLKYAEFLASRLNLSISSHLKEIYSERQPLKILVLGANFPVDRESVIKDGFNAVAAYLGSLGVDTTVDYVFGQWLTNPIQIKGVTGENLDVIKDVWIRNPGEVKNVLKEHIKGHHLTMYCYRSDIGNTPTELSEVFMGSVIGQLPIMDVSDSNWVSMFASHELLHGWYHRLNAEILLSKDSVHKFTWKEGYGEVVKNLLPFLPVILRPIPDKPYTPYIPVSGVEERKNYILNFVYQIINLIKNWNSSFR